MTQGFAMDGDRPTEPADAPWLRLLRHPFVLACCLIGIGLGLKFLFGFGRLLSEESRAGQELLMAGRLLELEPWHLLGLAEAAGWFVLPPLVLLAALWLLELLVSPRRGRGSYRLI